MVVHAVGRVLRCHHCGAESAIPRACPTCGNVDLKPMGRGTQRVEETLAAAFPGARIVRIDRDSARRRAELSHTLQGIQRGEADILVGTQLLVKGHDFPGLTLVGVLNADAALVSTDYHAAERLFAVLAQVAGRAGRREQQGEVLVQTRYPGHPLFAAFPWILSRKFARSCAKARCAFQPKRSPCRSSARRTPSTAITRATSRSSSPSACCATRGRSPRRSLMPARRRWRQPACSSRSPWRAPAFSISGSSPRPSWR